MSTPYPPRPSRVRYAMAVGLPILAVIALVLAYRATRPARDTGGPAAEPASSDVLQVGALPVT